jgi:hypothetical protein
MDAFPARRPTMKRRATIPENPAIPAAVLAGGCGPKLCLGEMSVRKMLWFGRWFYWGAFCVGFPVKNIGCWMRLDDLPWNVQVVGFKTDVDSKTFNLLRRITVNSFTHGWGRSTRDHG